MSFPSTYPYSPPTFRFLTKMWHPNIYEVRCRSGVFEPSSTIFFTSHILAANDCCRFYSPVMSAFQFYIHRSMIHKVENCLLNVGTQRRMLGTYQ